MKASDFSFDLPPSLIAQFPLNERRDSRLLVCDKASGELSHYHFRDIAQFLRSGDLLVMNNTKVVPARFYGQKETGGKLEFLLERIVDKTHCLCHIKASKAPKPGARLLLEQGHELRMLERQGRLFLCQLLSSADVLTMIESIGHMPLPPYIEREDTLDDKERYQTVYAKEKGAVAAPTAGLHFDKALLAELAAKGVKQVELTLHVGAGTFQPVQVEQVLDHQMHQEWIDVPSAVIEAIKKTKAAGGRVIAVGTTVVRSLETAALKGELQPFCGDTDIFIYPGFEFKVIDGMVTNFHLPESTLIMLVAAFIGHQQALDLYQVAVEQAYRFFSYGDACFLL